MSLVDAFTSRKFSSHDVDSKETGPFLCAYGPRHLALALSKRGQDRPGIFSVSNLVTEVASFLNHLMQLIFHQFMCKSLLANSRVKYM